MRKKKGVSGHTGMVALKKNSKGETTAPSALTGVSANNAGNTQATITWSAVTDATSYNIYWSTQG